MDVGLTCIFEGHEGSTDEEIWQTELRLADLAEPLGFDMLWSVEHHFTSYTMCPDVLQFLSYMAGRTEKIRLGSGAVILPWHDPIRVAEQVAVLDIISGGRFTLGIGRGLGRIEFEGLGIPMDESRARFVEAAEIILGALRTGTFEYEGEFFNIPRRELRPQPRSSFDGRVYAAAVSPESVRIMADVGAGILINPQKDWADVAEDLDQYREIFQELNGRQAPAPIVTGWVCCDQDPVKAKDMAQEYIGRYYEYVMNHYELAGRHFDETKGYEYYQKLAHSIQKHGAGRVVENFIDLQVWGTPTQCFDKIMDIRGQVGNDGFNAVCSFAGMTPQMAEANLRLFAAEVLPQLKKVPKLDDSEAAVLQ